MEHFEGLTREEMSDHLCIDEVTAKWILFQYTQERIIAVDESGIYRLIGKLDTNDLLPDALNTPMEKFGADRFA